MGNFLKAMQTLDCVSGLHNLLKFSQPPLVFRWEYVNTVKKVLFCLSSNRLLTKMSRHICSDRRKTIYYSTIPLRHRKHITWHSWMAISNTCKKLSQYYRRAVTPFLQGGKSFLKTAAYVIFFSFSFLIKKNIQNITLTEIQLFSRSVL